MTKQARSAILSLMTTATKTFSQTVDRRSKRAMATFLAEHERYSTMNSWNGASSYANTIKITHVVPDDVVMKAFDMLEVEEWQDEMSALIADFDRDHHYQWQAGTNGRSGGYLVLYQGYRKPSDYKSQCIECGQRNCKTIEESGSARCGRCHAEARVNRVMYDVGCWSGRGTDEHTGVDDFLEWSVDDLRDRVELVQSFDRLCDDIVASFVTYCRDYAIEEETRYSPYQVKVLA